MTSVSENRRQESCSTKNGKNGAVFLAGDCGQHKQRGELLVGCAGKRKNLLKEEFGEGSYSSCIHHEDLRHISYLGCGLPHLQQPQEMKSKCSYLIALITSCSNIVNKKSN